ncbi:MAG: ABC transporter substrate-binding protein [Lachnospiraceae bacterium]|nr:ABC transporter substrate-binding protein [Lachnospiraceae bacterium]
MKINSKQITNILIAILCIVFLTACGTPGSSETSQDSSSADGATSDASDQDLIVVGFSQVGAESDWRKENTQSMIKAFSAERGYDLILEDAQQKQSNQITAIRTFIQRDVDYIVLAPVTEEGWDTVLGEAKDAGIPVIIVDRKVATEDEDLFTCWIGSDFELEGKKVCTWLTDFCTKKGIAPDSLNIVDIQGTIGSSAQIGRTKGLVDAAAKNGWNIAGMASGEYTQAKGREVTAGFLGRFPEINVVYCENDNEAFGAIEAIEAAGKKAGSDIAKGEIMVLSFDGVSQEAIEDAREGKISCIGECNPLHGPRVEKIIKNLRQGVQPDKYIYVEEEVFSADQSITAVEVEGNGYPVTIIGQ